MRLPYGRRGLPSLIWGTSPAKTLLAEPKTVIVPFGNLHPITAPVAEKINMADSKELQVNLRSAIAAGLIRPLTHICGAQTRHISLPEDSNMTIFLHS